MKFESISQALELLDKHQATMAAYNHALGVLFHDGATVAPSESWAGRSQTMGVMSGIIYELETSPDVGEALDFLWERKEELTDVQRRQVEILRKSFEQMRKVPREEYVEYSVLMNDAQNVWENAKRNDDFAAFAPYLEKIVAFNRKFAGYYNPDMAPYDALLNEYEEGMTTTVLDGFFSKLRQTIVPLMEKIRQAEPIDDSFLENTYPIEIQKKLSEYLMDVLGLDRKYCAIAESEHPYTTNFNNKDVRITTHYHESNLTFSMYSVIHEGGHALYELGAEDQYNFTALSGGVSMGIHESQSRFYENIIGRSEPFIRCIFPKIQELFPEQLEGVTAEMFYRAVNKSMPSLIRTEADELSYCNHIMIRYEIEKQLIAGTLAVSDVPGEWNRLYREYLGIEVPNDREGCLQDSHWSGGMLGYFPSYALGSAYGPQLLKKMEEDLGDIRQDVERGDLTRVTGWLREKIHRHASFIKPGELFRQVCGQFDASYFTDYLTQKYTELYNL